MKGRNNARSHRGNYGESRSQAAEAKRKRPLDYSNIYSRFPGLRERPAKSSIYIPPSDGDV